MYMYYSSNDSQVFGILIDFLKYKLKIGNCVLNECYFDMSVLQGFFVSLYVFWKMLKLCGVIFFCCINGEIWCV